MNDFAALIEQCEKALRAGQVNVAHDLLRTLKVASVPRPNRLPLANLCRRSGLWNEGLRLLGGLARPENGEPPTASEQERAEYAILLMKIGSVDEAKSILADLSKKAVPEVEMFQAFCEMAQWNYEEAIVLLKSFLSDSTDPYQRLVARTNLASTLIWTENFQEAVNLLNNLISEAEETRSLRLLANALELRSQVFLHAADFSACENDLERARQILISHSTTDQLFIDKWLSISSALKLKSINPLLDFRQKALVRQNWESVRECDLYSLKIQFSEDTFQHLYCGTPFESYRANICQSLGKASPEGYFWYGSKSGPNLDLTTAQLTTATTLKGGSKAHQLIGALLKDFYKPVSIGSLFYELFPDEYYNVFSSPGRIRKIIERTRHFFSENNFPVIIDVQNERFSLRLSGDFSFRIPFHRSSMAGPQVQIEKLKQFFASNESQFTAEEVSERLQLSKPTARRILRWGVEHSKVIRSGAGPATLYRLAG